MLEASLEVVRSGADVFRVPLRVREVEARDDGGGVVADLLQVRDRLLEDSERLFRLSQRVVQDTQVDEDLARAPA